MQYNHISVLQSEIIDGLNIKPDGYYADGTLGGGGHSLMIAKKLSPEGKLIAIDQDEFAHTYSKDAFGSFPNVYFIKNNFSNIHSILDELYIDKISGMILDLGVSSFQLDDGERGFSYNHDALLDMRMDKKQKLTAYEVVNSYSEDRLAEIIYNYGEENWAKRIAEFIAAKRREHPIETTFQLVNIIKSAIPKKAREDGPHPAKRTFQSIRIEVNKELEVLEQAIADIIDRLEVSGRLCIITFHSLEDRIVKNTFKRLENPCTCPPRLPLCACSNKAQIEIITKKPITPSEEELDKNHRSRSAKLRIAEKL
ncbi:MAG: 16S rRNA (cytosine(1402)-N(4))-methyltransferase RsmH [Defluviitaleaceae bacterium]|nr:16S rRNA (cytosine(1402)-N(4))-methyltransferase RsmH [Defluviitaleaceae bacterium]